MRNDQTTPNNDQTAHNEANQGKAGKQSKAKPAAHPCPYCQRAGAIHILTPKGSKLECIVCGNVYWASDPTGALSQNALPGRG